MMTRISVLFLTVLLVSACERDELRPLDHQLKNTRSIVLEDGPRTLELDRSGVTRIAVPTVSREIFLDSLVSGYSFIPLETGDASLIGNIDKLVVASPYLFVLDRQNDKALRFSMDGAFLGAVGQKGKEYANYRRLNDLSVNPVRKELALLDLRGGYQLYYNYEGVFLRKQPLYYYYNRMEFLGDSLQVQLSDLHDNKRTPSVDGHQLLLSGFSQEPLYKGFSYPKELRRNFHWRSSTPLLRVNNEVYYHRILSDTVWQVEPGVCKARYALDFTGRPSLFRASEQATVSDRGYEAKTAGKRHFFGRYLLTGRWAYFGVGTAGKGLDMLLYNQKTGESVYGSVSKRGNPVFSLLLNTFDFAFDRHSLVRVLQPFDVIRMKEWLQEEGRWDSLSPEDRSFLDSLDEEANPVLMVVRFK